MKKYIIRLILCAVLLLCLLLITQLIHSKVNKPVTDTPTGNTTTQAGDTTTDPQLSSGNATGVTDESGLTDLSGATGPNGATNPDGSTKASDPTDPNGGTSPSGGTEPSGTSPTNEPTTAPTATTKKPPSGQNAPAVNFYDANGNAVSLRSFSDKPVVLFFWASWATNSDESLNLIREAYNLNGDKVHFVVINLTNSARETRESADAFWAAGNYPFPTYYDLDGVCQAAFKVDTVPTTFFIKEGNLALAYFKGNLTRYGLRMGLETILPKSE